VVKPKCVICRRQMTSAAFMVCLRPDGSEDGTREEWLCGRKRCEERYSDDDVKEVKK